MTIVDENETRFRPALGDRTAAEVVAEALGKFVFVVGPDGVAVQTWVGNEPAGVEAET
jgi:hypothetical protein